MSELPTQIDPQAWIEGVRDAYTGRPSRPDAPVGSDLAMPRAESRAKRFA